LISAYGFSIVEIVRKNLKKKTIHFGGIKDQEIRECYTYDTTDEDGNIKSLPLFADISVRTLQHTFTHPKGLFFTTQFMQIALVVTSRAALGDMRSKGLVQPGAPFAGHSLGGFPALAAVADIPPNFSR
jgi:fatty acid synthase subunit alpha